MANSLNSWSESDKQAIGEQLDRILKSAPFLQSQRRQRFLEFIVNESLAGRGERLKGYNIALEVFDRPESFDPVIDPIVRIEAGRLREKLREYYETEGRNDSVRIEMPKGSYGPHIELRQANAAVVEVEGRATADAGHPPEATEAPIGPQSADTPTAYGWTKRHIRWQTAATASALIVMLGVAGLWIARDTQPTLQGAAKEAGGATGPAIAVLPFLNLSGDSKQDYFSDGLTEDIMTELARARDLRVLARNTTFRYKGRSVDVMKLRDDLNVRYVLEGSVRRTDDRLRVTAQLIDTETGTHVWADRYDREMADVFMVQDDIVSQIVAKIAGNYGIIDVTEARSSTRKKLHEIQAYDLVLRAQDVMRPEWSSNTFGTAREMLRQAIAIDPTNARALRELAWLAVIGWVFRFDETPVPQQEIVAQAAKAVQLDPADARSRMVAAAAYFWSNQLVLFEREADQALALAPHDGEVLATLGCMLASEGQKERGVALAEKANALNPDAAIGWYHATLFYYHYLKGDYERALEFRRLHPDQRAVHAYIEYIPVLGQLGRKQEALENFRKLLEIDRGWTAKNFEDWYRLWNMPEEDITKMMDGVRKSGVLGTESPDQ